MKDFYFMLGLAVFWNVAALLATMVGMPHLIVMVWAGISIQFAVMSVGTILHDNFGTQAGSRKAVTMGAKLSYWQVACLLWII